MLFYGNFLKFDYFFVPTNEVKSRQIDFCSILLANNTTCTGHLQLTIK